jgi:hypothetical protein
MHTYDYSPNAYFDLEYCQKFKGTRFVMHADASHYGQEFELDGQYYKVSGDDEASIRAYGRLVVDIVNTHGLDGVDFDYEGWGAQQLFWVIDEVGKSFGPKGTDPEKLLIVDYFGGYPDGNVEPYIDYLVKQAYAAQGAGVGGPSWCPAEKMVYCDQYEQSSSEGPNYLNGGYPTNMTNPEGEKMYMLEYYARYASEAAEAFAEDFCRQHGIDYLIAVMDVDNPASRKTAEKSGFRLFEKRTVYDYRYNRYADDYFYFRRYWSGCTLKDRYYGDSPYYGRSTSDRKEEP